MLSSQHKRKAPVPTPEKKVTKSPKVTKSSKRKAPEVAEASEQEEEAIEEPVVRQNPKRGARKVSDKTESSKAKNVKAKAKPAKKPLTKKRKAKSPTPSLSPSDSSSSSEDTESDRDLSEPEFTPSEEESFRLAEERKYAMKVRTHGERTRQKLVKPSKEDIVLVKKLPKLTKNYVPQDLKKKITC